MNEPNIYEYLDVRFYLKDLYKYRKFKEKSFSYSHWAEELGIKSRGNLRDIVTGQSVLSDALIPCFLNFFGNDEERKEYFVILAKYSFASTEEIKGIYGKRLLPLWKRKLHELEIQDIEGFLSDPIVPVVFTYLTFDDVSTNVSEMAIHMGCTEVRIQNALKFLIWNKLIDGEVLRNGSIKYKAVSQFFKVPNFPNNSFIRNYHINNLKLAEEAHDYNKDSRKFHSYLMALTPDQFNEAVEIIKKCNDQLLTLFNSNELGDKKIYLFNHQMFPVYKAQKQVEDSGI